MSLYLANEKREESLFLSEKPLVVIATASFDHNGAYTNECVQNALQTRCDTFKANGFHVHHIENCRSISELASFAQQRFQGSEIEEVHKTHPRIFMMIWRGHGNNTGLIFSEDKGGVVSLNADQSYSRVIEQTCKAIERGGILVTESCCNGQGKESFSKYLANFCNYGVVVVGSKISGHEIDTRLDLPRYQRFKDQNTGKDVSRIYYVAQEGKVQNICPEQFDILWDFLGSSDDTFELCYSLLGERNVPEAYSRILSENEHILAPFVNQSAERKEEIKTWLRDLKFTFADVGPVWQGMLQFFESYYLAYHPVADCISQAPIPYRMRCSFQTNGGDFWWEKSELSEEQRSYFFLLGVAILQKNKAIFQLFDHSDDQSNLFLSEMIFALSGIAVHGDTHCSTFKQLKESIIHVKMSYESAVIRSNLDEWCDIVKENSGGCLNKLVEPLFEFYLKNLNDINEAFEIMWKEIWNQLSEEHKPELFDVEAKRAWLRNQDNAEILAKISILDLSNRDLNVVPPEIGCLTSLGILELSNNQIKAVPEEINKLVNLWSLDLSNNGLTQLPKVINLPNLDAFYLSRNQLAELPVKLNLPKLRQFHLSSNQLSNLPDCNSLELLEILDMSYNELVDLPEPMNLPNLKELNLSFNELMSFPIYVKLPKLEKLFLSRNSFLCLPDMNRFINLKVLDLSSNMLSKLPMINYLKNLQELKLSSNNITDMSGINHLPNLRVVDFSSNDLRFFPEIINLPNLEKLYLCFNQLTSLPKINSEKQVLVSLYSNSLFFVLDKEFNDVLDIACNGFEIDISFDESKLVPWLEVQRKLDACLQYQPGMPLASLAQSIQSNDSIEIIVQKFNKLPDEMRYAVSSLMFVLSALPSADSEFEIDMINNDNQSEFANAVIYLVKERFLSLSDEKKARVYINVSVLAKQPSPDPKWGEANAGSNIIRFIDAMEYVLNETKENQHPLEPPKKKLKKK